MATVVEAVAGQRGGPGTLTVLGADASMTRVSWAAVHERARRLASALNGLGVAPGSRVGLLADTSVDLVTVLQAVWLAAAAVTVLPLPARQDPASYLAQVRRTAADARLQLVVVGSPVQALQPPLAPTVSTVALDELVRRADTAQPATPLKPAPADLAILQYTSGSTREPRGVPVTHRNLAANLAAIRAATGHDRVHGCMLGWLPLYHDMGLVGLLSLAMSCGCPLVLLSPVAFAARPVGWLEAIAAHRATATVAPNFAWALATRLLAARPAPDSSVALGSLRLAMSGGEPVDAEGMRRFLDAAARHGLDPSVATCGYGLAEATLAVTVTPPGAGLRVDLVDPAALETRGEAVPPPDGGSGRALARLGWPVPGTQVRIVDRVNGRELDQRRVGLVEVAGPGVVGGYWGDPPNPARRWLRTGDLGYHAEGELVVCGREKDVIFAAGRNVYPQDVEAAAAGVAGVRAGSVTAFATPAPAGDRLVVAVESRRWDRPGDRTAIRAAVTAAVTAEVGLTPAAVVVLPPGRLPKTSSGKLRRAETRRQYLTGELDTPEPLPAPAKEAQQA